MSLSPVNVDQLEFNDAARVEWVRVQAASGLLWKDNPKRHDIGAIIESVKRYGFQERPKFDVNLPNTSGSIGAIVAGNGRVEALAAMERDGRYELPRGLARDKDGAWCLPLLVGTDARSEEMAAAYGLDANNLTLAGGDFTAFESLRLWDETYVATLVRLAQAEEMPISVPGDDLDLLLALEKGPESPDEFPEYGEDIAEDIEWAECPKCGHRWPK